MKVSLIFVVLIVLSILCLVRSAIENDKLPQPPSEGYLIVQKKLKVDPSDGNSLFAQGKNFTVDIRLYNVGTSPVYDVEVEDDWPQQNFTLKQGKTRFKFDDITPGENMQFNFTITPNVEGEYIVPPAVIKYHPTSMEKASLQIGYSTPAKKKYNILAFGNISKNYSETLY